MSSSTRALQVPNATIATKLAAGFTPFIWFTLSMVAGLIGLAYFHQLDLGTHFQSMTGDHGDNRFIAYTLEHTYQAFLGAANILSPQMFYPVTGTLGYSDSLFGIAPIYWALRSAGCCVLASTQWTIIIGNFLTYLITLGLMRLGLKIGRFASIMGALFFAYNSAKFNQLNHLQLQPLFIISGIAWLMAILYKRRNILNPKQAFVLIATVGLLFDLQLYTSVYIGWYFAFLCLLVILLGLCWKDVRGQSWLLVKTYVKPILAALTVSGIALIPFLKIYLPVLRESGWRNYSEVLGMMPQWISFLYMGHLNYLWGWLPGALPELWALPLHWEHRIGLGAVCSLCSLTTVFACTIIYKRSAKDRALPPWVTKFIGREDKTYLLFVSTFVLAVGLFYLLTIRIKGPDSGWRLVFHTVPGARSIRAVARFVLVTTLPLSAVLAAILDNHLFKASQMRNRFARFATTLSLVFLASLALAEQAGTTSGFSVDGEWERISKFSRALESDCQAFYITADPSVKYPVWELQLDAMLVSQLTGIPTLNGYSGQAPKQWELWEIRDPAYEARVQSWTKINGLSGKICRVLIDR